MNQTKAIPWLKLSSFNKLIDKLINDELVFIKRNKQLIISSKKLK